MKIKRFIMGVTAFLLIVIAGCVQDTQMIGLTEKCRELTSNITDLNTQDRHCLSVWKSLPFILSQKELQRKRQAYNKDVVCLLSGYDISLTEADLETIWKSVTEETLTIFQTIMVLVSPVAYQWAAYKDEVLDYAVKKCTNETF